MSDELWGGVEFKVAEAQFFLDCMGKTLVPPSRGSHPLHSSMMGHLTARWQPDFYYYLDAFLAAGRSVPDVIQKCFGEDRERGQKWLKSLLKAEQERRQKFQEEFTGLYTAFHELPLSRVRAGTFHWLGVPSVQTMAKVFAGQEYTGGPLERVPDAASRERPPESDPAFAVLASHPLPVEPSWQDFTVQVPQGDGTTLSIPLFDECRAYLHAAQKLVAKARTICAEVHGTCKLTPPPSVK